jgi:hypothetical protein
VLLLLLVLFSAAAGSPVVFPFSTFPSPFAVAEELVAVALLLFISTSTFWFFPVHTLARHTGQVKLSLSNQLRKQCL